MITVREFMYLLVTLSTVSTLLSVGVMTVVTAIFDLVSC
jgi:hypothetical protein